MEQIGFNVISVQIIEASDIYSFLPSLKGLRV